MCRCLESSSLKMMSGFYKASIFSLAVASTFMQIGDDLLSAVYCQVWKRIWGISVPGSE